MAECCDEFLEIHFIQKITQRINYLFIFAINNRRMNKTYRSAIAIILIACITSCKQTSKFAIDREPGIKIDSSLLGIWKAVEDTDSRNYFFVQTNYDVHGGTDNYFTIYDNNYYITYFNMHGKNPLYQQWSVFLSQVGRHRFLNIGDVNTELGGYIFLSLIKATNDSLTTAVVADTMLKYANSNKEVRKRIEKNMSTPAFCSDTLHLYKVSGYHLSLRGSMKIANPK